MKNYNNNNNHNNNNNNIKSYTLTFTSDNKKKSASYYFVCKYIIEKLENILSSYSIPIINSTDYNTFNINIPENLLLKYKLSKTDDIILNNNDTLGKKRKLSDTSNNNDTLDLIEAPGVANNNKSEISISLPPSFNNNFVSSCNLAPSTLLIIF